MEAERDPVINRIDRFIVVDDDSTNNLICKLTIQRAIPEADVISFINAQHALDHIRSTEVSDQSGKQVLLLDINMPDITGWDFIELYAKFPKETHERFLIYMVSSSVDQRDQLRAQSNPLVAGFISKPLKIEYIQKNFRNI